MPKQKPKPINDKPKGPILCAQCSCELSVKEMNTGAVYVLEGELYGTGRYLCAICRGDLEYRIGFRDKDY